MRIMEKKKKNRNNRDPKGQKKIKTPNNDKDNNSRA